MSPNEEPEALIFNLQIKTRRRHSMKYYAGLDVAMKETFICIVNEEGERVFESKATTDPFPLYEELSKSGYELEKIGLETGSLSLYLTNGLQELGMNAICIDARKMAAILSVTVNKTDKNDARGIAEAMRCNHYKPIHLQNSQSASLGILLKSRSTLVENRIMLKNTIRESLKLMEFVWEKSPMENFPNGL